MGISALPNSYRRDPSPALKGTGCTFKTGSEIYSPYDPDYCQAAVEAIDAFCLEVSRLQCGPRRLVIEETALRVILDYRKIR
jgi:hypothetical protein